MHQQRLSNPRLTIKLTADIRLKVTRINQNVENILVNTDNHIFY